MQKLSVSNRLTTIAVFLICLSAAGCATITDTPKYQFVDGYYHTEVGDKSRGSAYVVVTEDTIKVYPAKRKAVVDTTKETILALPSQEAPNHEKNFRFSQRTFDLDVLTVLFKYRPAVDHFPNQFNTTFNGAVYAGYRYDVYKISYEKTPFGSYKRATNHYGFSMGAFTGLGSSRMDEYVTLNRLNTEYDGFVNLTGIAAIFGVNKLSVGLNMGVDHLLDKNHSLWVNNAKPWIGLSLGLNLN